MPLLPTELFSLALETVSAGLDIYNTRKKEKAFALYDKARAGYQQKADWEAITTHYGGAVVEAKRAAALGGGTDVNMQDIINRLALRTFYTVIPDWAKRQEGHKEKFMQMKLVDLGL